MLHTRTKIWDRKKISRNLDDRLVADALRKERELRAINEIRQGNRTTDANNAQIAEHKTCKIYYRESYTAGNCQKLGLFS